jgi:hypothetical protein
MLVEAAKCPHQLSVTPHQNRIPHEGAVVTALVRYVFPVNGRIRELEDAPLRTDDARFALVPQRVLVELKPVLPSVVYRLVFPPASCKNIPRQRVRSKKKKKKARLVARVCGGESKKSPFHGLALLLR